MNKKLLLASSIFSSILALSTDSSAGIVEMTGNVDFSNPTVNFNPSFNNGDIIVVTGSGTMNIPDPLNIIVDSMIINSDVNNITLFPTANSTICSLTVGSITGTNTVKNISIGVRTFSTGSLNLQGSNYSALEAITITQAPSVGTAQQVGILNINSPITLNSSIRLSSGGSPDGRVNINDNVTLTNTMTIELSTANITTNIAANKSLTLAKDNALNGSGKFIFNIASNGSLNINGNNTTLNGSVNFNGSNATLNINGSGTTIKGNQIFTNPTINLGLNTLNLNGKVTTSGTMTMILKHSGLTAGSISVSGGNLDLSGLDQLVISPVPNLYDLPEKEYVYTLISANGGTITPIDESKISIDDDELITRYIQYTPNNDLTLHIKDISDQVLIEDLQIWITDPNNQLTTEETAFVNLLKGQSFDTLTDGIVFLNNLGFSTVERARETIDRVITSAPPSSSNYNNLTIQSQNAISLASTAVSNRMTEVSAGDETLKGSYGLWVSPLFSRGIKRHESGLNGYKEKSEGIMLGADTLINDQFLLGFSYGRIHNKLSYKDLRDGDNTKARSNIFALYGSYNELGNPWLTETILSFANSRIKNKATRLIYNDVEIAASNFKSKAYGGQVLEGYNFLMANNITLTPLAGIRYGYYKNSSYQETGTSFQNLRVKGKSYSKIEGIAGFRSSTDWQYKKFAFIPELHGYLDYNLTKKRSPSIDVRLQGINAPLPVKSNKASRALFTLGTSITTKSEKMEFGAGFDAFLAKKYYAYQGSLKLRVNL